MSTDPFDLAAHDLRTHHLLLVDDSVQPSDVEVLLSNVLPRLQVEGNVFKLSRYSTLTGPLEVSGASAIECWIPENYSRAYVLTAPTEREPEAPPEWFAHPEGLERLFPRGLPMREEERCVELLIALARRLHCAVRFADDGATGWGERIIVPDPDAHPEIMVFSQYWVTSDLMLPIAQAAVPDGQVSDTSANIDAEVDGYALEVDLGEDAGLIELGVHIETALPNIVQRHSGGPQVAYTIRWHSGGGLGGAVDGSGSGLADADDPHYRQMRAAARSIIEDLARAVGEATGGIAVDRDGFLLSVQQLEG